MVDEELKRVLGLEYREWITKITAIFRDRDKQISEFRRQSLSRANPDAALTMWSRPVRLEALRMAVESRLGLRSEYAGHQPQLLSDDSLSTLYAELERFVENSIQGDQRSLPEGGDIIAELRVGIDKLALSRPSPTSVQAFACVATESPVFISYSWDNEPHKQWVLGLATRIRTEGGIDVILDQWHLELGARITEFMERRLRDSNRVLVICTEAYKHRFDNRAGGVGYEGHIISAEIINGAGKNKFIPVLRRGDWESAVPTALAGVYGVDLTKDSDTEYRRLLHHLLGMREIPPIDVHPDNMKRVVTGPDQSESSDSLDGVLGLGLDALRLCSEKRGGALAIWLRNETLDPIEHCSVTLTDVQQYSERHRDFQRNPFAPVLLIRRQTINAGGTSNEAAALARCDSIHNKILTLCESSFNTGATWLADLLLSGDGQRRKETLFFRWVPGEEPEFTTDPRV